MSDNVKVVIRVRPLIEREARTATSNWSLQTNSIQQLDNTRNVGTEYRFDRIFDPNETTNDLYEESINSIIEGAMQGFNGTIFAYGQTGSGKTFTMSGSALQPGVTPQAMQHIYDMIESTPQREFLLRVSYMEIYQEKVSDMLSYDPTKHLKLQEDNERQVSVVGLTEEVVASTEDVLKVIHNGDRYRRVGVTAMNDQSSRSHAIFRMIIESRERAKDGESDNADRAVIVSHLNFVDLAGSERASENAGERLREGCSINKSLLMLSRVIYKLSENDSGNQYISYRDSKLTRILQNALGGNSKMAMICTITMASIDETHSTLRFASSAKSIKTRATVNKVLSDKAVLRQYRSEIHRLQGMLEEYKNTGVDDLQKKYEESQFRIKQLNEKICVSSVTGLGAVPKKKKLRRETWCPGRTLSVMPLSKLPDLFPALMEDSLSETSDFPEGVVVTDESFSASVFQQTNVSEQEPIPNQLHLPEMDYVQSRRKRAILEPCLEILPNDIGCQTESWLKDKTSSISCISTEVQTDTIFAEKNDSEPNKMETIQRRSDLEDSVALCTDLFQCRENLQTKLENINQELDRKTMKVAELEETLFLAKVEYENLDHEYKELQEFTCLEKEFDVNSRSNKQTCLQDEVTSLKSQLEQFKKEKEELDLIFDLERNRHQQLSTELKQQLQDAYGEISDLRNKFDLPESNEMQMRVAMLEEEIHQHDEQIRETISHYETLMKAANDKHSELEKIGDDLNAANERIQTLTVELNAQRQYSKEKDDELLSVRLEMKALKVRADDIKHVWKEDGVTMRKHNQKKTHTEGKQEMLASDADADYQEKMHTEGGLEMLASGDDADYQEKMHTEGRLEMLASDADADYQEKMHTEGGLEMLASDADADYQEKMHTEGRLEMSISGEDSDYQDPFLELEDFSQNMFQFQNEFVAPIEIKAKNEKEEKYQSCHQLDVGDNLVQQIRTERDVAVEKCVDLEESLKQLKERFDLSRETEVDEMKEKVKKYVKRITDLEHQLSMLSPITLKTPKRIKVVKFDEASIYRQQNKSKALDEDFRYEHLEREDFALELDAANSKITKLTEEICLLKEKQDSVLLKNGTELGDAEMSIDESANCDRLDTLCYSDANSKDKSEMCTQTDQNLLVSQPIGADELSISRQQEAKLDSELGFVKQEFDNYKINIVNSENKEGSDLHEGEEGPFRHPKNMDMTPAVVKVGTSEESDSRDLLSELNFANRKQGEMEDELNRLRQCVSNKRSSSDETASNALSLEDELKQAGFDRGQNQSYSSVCALNDFSGLFEVQTNEYDDLNASVMTDLEKELNLEKLKVKQMEDNLRKVLEEQSEKYSDQKTELTEANAKIAALQESIESYNADGEIEACQKSMQLAISQKDDEIDRLKANVLQFEQRKEYENEIFDSIGNGEKDIISMLEAEVHEYESKLSYLEESFKTKMGVVKAENSQLEASSSALHAECARLSTELNDVRDNIEGLKKDLESKNVMLEEKDTELADVEDVIMSLESKANDSETKLKETRDNCEYKLSLANSKIMELKDELCEMKAELGRKTNAESVLETNGEGDMPLKFPDELSEKCPDELSENFPDELSEKCPDELSENFPDELSEQQDEEKTCKDEPSVSASNKRLAQMENELLVLKQDLQKMSEDNDRLVAELFDVKEELSQNVLNKSNNLADMSAGMKSPKNYADMKDAEVECNMLILHDPELSDAKEMIIALEEQLSDLHLKMTDLKKADVENNEIEEQVNETRGKMEIEELTSRLLNADNEAEQLTRELEQLHAEINEKDTILGDCDNILDKVEADHKTQIDESNNKLVTLGDELCRVKNALQQTCDEKEAAVQQCQLVIAELEEVIKSKREVIKDELIETKLKVMHLEEELQKQIAEHESKMCDALEEISSLKLLSETKQVELEQLQSLRGSDLQDSNDKIVLLETELHDCNAKMMDMKIEVATGNDLATEIREELDNKDAELEEAMRNVLEGNAKAARDVAQLREKLEEKDKLIAECSDIISEEELIETKLKIMHLEEELQKQIAEHESKMCPALEEISSLKLMSETKQVELEQFQSLRGSDLQDSNDKIALLETELHDCNAKMMDMKMEVATGNDLATEIREELDNKEAELEEAMRKVLEGNAKAARLVADVAQLREELQEAMRNVLEGNAKAARLVADVAHLREELEEKDKLIAECADIISEEELIETKLKVMHLEEELQKQIAEHGSKMCPALEEISSLKLMSETKQVELEQLQSLRGSDLQDSNDKIVLLETELHDCNAKMMDMKMEVATGNDLATEIREELDNKEAELEEAMRKVLEGNAKAARLVADVAQLREELDEAMRKMLEGNAKAARLVTDVAHLREELEKAMRKVLEGNAKAARLFADVAQLQEELEEKDKLIADCADIISKLEEDHKAALDAATAQMAEVSDEHVQVKNEFHQEIANKQEELHQANRDISKLEQLVETKEFELNSYVQTQETEPNCKKEKITLLEKEIANNLEQHQNEIANCIAVIEKHKTEQNEMFAERERLQQDLIDVQIAYDFNIADIKKYFESKEFELHKEKESEMQNSLTMIDNLKELLESKERELNQLQQNQEDKFVSIKRKMSILENEWAQSKTPQNQDLTASEGHISKLEEERRKILAEKSDLRDELDRLRVESDNKIKEMEERHDCQASQMLDEQRAKMNNASDEIRKMTEILVNKESELHQQQKIHYSELYGMKENLALMVQRLTTIKQEHESDVKKAETQMTEMEADQTNLIHEKKCLEEERRQLQLDGETGMRELQARLESKEQQLEQSQWSQLEVTSNASSAAEIALESQIKELEERLKAAKLEDVQQKNKFKREDRKKAEKIDDMKFSLSGLLKQVEEDDIQDEENLAKIHELEEKLSTETSKSQALTDQLGRVSSDEMNSLKEKVRDQKISIYDLELNLRTDTRKLRETVAGHEQTIEYYAEKVSQLKNEIRKLQQETADSTVCLPKTKPDSQAGADRAPAAMNIGVSSRSGVHDAYAVYMLEAQVAQLQKQLKAADEKYAKFKNFVTEKAQQNKENQELSQTSSVKKSLIEPRIRDDVSHYGSASGLADQKKQPLSGHVAPLTLDACSEDDDHHKEVNPKFGFKVDIPEPPPRKILPKPKPAKGTSHGPTDDCKTS